METKANYVLIGAFTLITGLALLAFGLWAAKYSPTAPGRNTAWCSARR
jgi:ABC-type transporter Mla subunit MlaD